MASMKKLLQQINRSGYRTPAQALEKTLTTGDVLAYSYQFQINESNEPLFEIKNTDLSIIQPHPHISIGAPYGDNSPFCARKGVLARLQKAQALLTLERPDFKLHIYDAYRPLAVQQFMIDHEFGKLCRIRSIDPKSANEQTRQSLMDEVLMVWAKPDTKATCPPPHSTGAAVDLTIIDDRGQWLTMGSEIDAIGEVSLPNHFAAARQKPQIDYHGNRELLNRMMIGAGFRRLPHEWWHFSYGDQVWALLEWLDNPDTPVNAVYGRVE